MKHLILSSLLLMLSARAWACSCLGIASIDEAISEYPILAEAQVESLEEVSSSYGREVLSATLRVNHVLKGDVHSKTITIKHGGCYASLHPEIMKVRHTYVLPLQKAKNDLYSMAQCAHSGMELVDGRLYTFEQGNGLERKLRFYKAYDAFQQGIRRESPDGR